MKTFDLDVHSTVRVVVRDETVQGLRAVAAQCKHPLINTAALLHPEDDDAFILMILRTDLRRAVHRSLEAFITEIECTGSVSPVSAKQIDRTMPPTTEPLVLDGHGTHTGRSIGEVQPQPQAYPPL